MNVELTHKIAYKRTVRGTFAHYSRCSNLLIMGHCVDCHNQSDTEQMLEAVVTLIGVFSLVHYVQLSVVCERIQGIV